MWIIYYSSTHWTRKQLKRSQCTSVHKTFISLIHRSNHKKRRATTFSLLTEQLLIAVQQEFSKASCCCIELSGHLSFCNKDILMGKPPIFLPNWESGTQAVNKCLSLRGPRPDRRSPRRTFLSRVNEMIFDDTSQALFLMHGGFEFHQRMLIRGWSAVIQQHSWTI